jgi:ribosomal-protein-alanine N-acetyltransferase
MLNSNLLPTLTTERLLLRQLKTTDDQAVFRIRSNEIVYKYIAKTTQINIKEAQAFIVKTNKGIANKEFLYWAITVKETHELVGTICLWNFSKDKLIAEVGYELLPDYHKKGIMNEAINKVIDFGFSVLNLKTIEAFTHKKNEASKILLIRNGFKLDAKRTDEGFPNNIIYTITN